MKNGKNGKAALRAAVDELGLLKAEKTRLEEREKALREQVLSELEKLGQREFEGEVFAVKALAVERSVFDGKRFAAEHPDLDKLYRKVEFVQQLRVSARKV